MLCACNNGDEPSDNIADLIPIEKGDDIAEISDFFKKTFDTDEIRQKPFNFKNNLCNDEKKTCLVINSQEEFEEAYTGDTPLPTIDFSKYSLIIGKVYIDAGTFIDNMSIKQINNSRSVLTINYIIDTKGCYIALAYYKYYWKLFPKFHTSEIVIEETVRYEEVDDSKK